MSSQLNQQLKDMMRLDGKEIWCSSPFLTTGTPLLKLDSLFLRDVHMVLAFITQPNVETEITVASVSDSWDLFCFPQKVKNFWDVLSSLLQCTGLARPARLCTVPRGGVPIHVHSQDGKVLVFSLFKNRGKMLWPLSEQLWVLSLLASATVKRLKSTFHFSTQKASGHPTVVQPLPAGSVVTV